MGIFDEIDFAELLNRVRATTDGDELRHLFFAALQRMGVKYCTGLMVSWGSDGSPVGTVVAQNLPVIPLSFEQACERRSQILSMTASLGDQPVEIDAQSVVSMGPDWRERFQEGRDEFDFEWCLVAPVWREGILRAVAFYLAEKKAQPADNRLAHHAFECLLRSSRGGRTLAGATLAPDSAAARRACALRTWKIRLGDRAAARHIASYGARACRNREAQTRCADACAGGCSCDAESLDLAQIPSRLKHHPSPDECAAFSPGPITPRAIREFGVDAIQTGKKKL